MGNVFRLGLGPLGEWVFLHTIELSEESTCGCPGEGSTSFVQKLISVIMLTLLLTSLPALTFGVRLVKAGSGILCVNDFVSGSSMDQSSNSTVKSFVKDELSV
jgi:hypothetical protein